MNYLNEIVISLSLGIAANLNPCVLPLYPGFLSYLSSKSEISNKALFTRLSGIIVLTGVLTFMIIIGIITASLGLSISKFVNTFSPFAFGILLFLGILLLLNIEFTRFLPKGNVPILNDPYLNAFIFGFLYGPIIIPCNAPLVFAVFAFSASLGGFFDRFLLFIVFGLGLGIPLLLISFISSAKGSWLVNKFIQFRPFINRIAGLLLILLSLYELIFVFRILG